MRMLEIIGLTLSYGRAQVVHGVDLHVSQGEIICLIGANGAGKTSLLRACAGLLAPRGGRILLDGQDITGRPPHRIARAGLALVPEGRQIFETLSVADNLQLGAWRVANAGVVAERRAAMLARFPRLGERATQEAGSLSGGEQQMLALGRALMGGPKLLLLDEPSMGLAPLIIGEIFRTIAQLREAGMTILLVEQNAHAALAVADRAYVLESGRITLAGTAAELAQNPAVVAAYLGG